MRTLKFLLLLFQYHCYYFHAVAVQTPEAVVENISVQLKSRLRGC